MTKLKPCPFCGSKATIITPTNEVRCYKENCVLNLQGSYPHPVRTYFSVSSWNTRPGEEALLREGFEAGVDYEYEFQRQGGERPSFENYLKATEKDSDE